MQAKLTTQRLSLNTLAVEDHAFIQELVNSEGWLRFIGERNVHSTEEAINYIHKINGTQQVHYWVVRLRDEHLPVGIITFLKRSYLEHFDIGFAFLPQFSGSGYAYEAAKEVLSMVRSEPAHVTVLATTLPENARSIRLLTKLGLRFEREIDVEGNSLHVYRLSPGQEFDRPAGALS